MVLAVLLVACCSSDGDFEFGGAEWGCLRVGLLPLPACDGADTVAALFNPCLSFLAWACAPACAAVRRISIKRPSLCSCAPRVHQAPPLSQFLVAKRQRPACTLHAVYTIAHALALT